MEILITGGAGFIGSHILAQLQGRRDMDVVVFDNLSSGSKEHVPAGMELVEGDVCDEAAVDALFADHHFDAVIHLAAQTMVPTSVEQPVLDCRINLEGVLHVLEACRIHGPRHILFRPVPLSTATTSISPEGNGTARADVLMVLLR